MNRAVAPAVPATSLTDDVQARPKPPGIYFNCAEARAAGVAPLRRSDPGYSSHLDRDGDGIACE